MRDWGLRATDIAIIVCVIGVFVVLALLALAAAGMPGG
jgi:hypothetical protein